jgi:hypothetical protein
MKHIIYNTKISEHIVGKYKTGAYLRHPKAVKTSGSSSVGRAQPCQGWGRGFESRLPLSAKKIHPHQMDLFLSKASFVLPFIRHPPLLPQ